MAEKDKYADEVMSDEELDGIAGGTVGQTVVDSKFLYDHGLVDDWHGNTHTFFNWKSDSALVDAGWAKAGITCVTTFGFSNNKYFKDGKEITHDEAVAHVKANFSKIRDCDA